jgi:hypothetical protein
MINHRNKIYLLATACVCASILSITIFFTLQSNSTCTESSPLEFDVYTNVHGDAIHSYASYYVSINDRLYFVAKVITTGRQGELNFYTEYPDHIIEAKINPKTTALTKIGKISLNPSSKNYGTILQYSPITSTCVPIITLPKHIVNELKEVATNRE